jgi:hypothetical protein
MQRLLSCLLTPGFSPPSLRSTFSLPPQASVSLLGRTLTLTQADVFAINGGQEKLIALLTGTLMVVKGRDGISD